MAGCPAKAETIPGGKTHPAYVGGEVFVEEVVEMVRDLGVSATPTGLAGAEAPEPHTGLGPTGGIPDALDAALRRLHKFALEWKVMQLRSSYGHYIYELHPGDPRHAVCSVDDLILVLETFNDG